MPVKIAINNPAFLLKNKIIEITNEFLNDFHLNYFQFLRCYSNGSMGLLANNTSALEYFQHIDNAPVIFSSFDKEHMNSHSYWFLWDEKLPYDPVK